MKIPVVPKIDVSDMIRAIVKNDPLREIPEIKEILDLPKKEYEERFADPEEEE